MPAPSLETEALPLTVNFRHGRWSASWAMTLLTLLAVLAFLDLGRWQWHRAQHKRALAAAFHAGDSAVQPLAGSSAALPRYTQVRAQGRYDGEHQFLLDNMSHDGQPGYQVLTPLRLDDGRTLIINRGWLPLTASRRQLPVITIDVSAELSPAGKLDALPVAGIALGHVPPETGPQWPKAHQLSDHGGSVGSARPAAGSAATAVEPGRTARLPARLEAQHQLRAGAPYFLCGAMVGIRAAGAGTVRGP